MTGSSEVLAERTIRTEGTLMPQTVQRALDGEESAFAELVRQTQDRVYSTLYRWMGDSEDAEDLAQEVYLRAFRSLKEFRGEAAFETWITRIAINVGRDALRKRRPWYKKIFFLGTSESFSIEVADETLHPARRLDHEETVQMVKRGLDSLSEERRLLLVLRDIEGMSYEEIGQTLEMPVGTVKSRISRARSDMRRILAPAMEER